MSRFRNPVPKFLYNDGTPLAKGLLYFYEPNTAIEKDTFSDSALTIANTNPVELYANGDTPNIFYTGTAKVILTDSAFVQLWERDPVTSGEWSIDSDPIFLYDHNADGTHLVYESISDIRASTLTSFDGQVIKSTGYNAGTEAKKWFFRRNETSTETDNNGTIIKTTSTATGRWESLLNDTVSFDMFGPVADGVTADDDVFLDFLSDIHTKKIKGYIPKGDYGILFVTNRALTNDINIECHPEARFIGLPTKQDFAGSGQTSLTVTVWQKGTKFLLTYTTGGVETTWTEDTEFTVSGQVIDLTGGSAPHGALAVGDSVRVSDSLGMFQIGASTLDGCRFSWSGGYFDSSARGYQQNAGSGTAFTLYNFEQCHVSAAKFYGSEDYETAWSDGVSDSGLTTITCSNVVINKNHFQGFADLGIYVTGGSSVGITDDGYGVSIHSNRFLKCSGGASIKRAGQGGSITNNSFEYCRTGSSLVGTGDIPYGATGSISNNFFWRTGRAAVDVRGTNGAITNDNIMIDWGKKLDGTTPIGNPAAVVEYLGVQNGMVSGNTMMMVDWTADGQMIGVQLGKDTSLSTLECNNCIVSGNSIDGADIGYDENNAGVGNIWTKNNILNTTTPVSVLAARKWDYTESNIKYSGIGSVEFQGSFTPVVTFTVAGTVVHTIQDGRYLRDGNTCFVYCRVDFSYTGTSAGNQMRIGGLLYTANSSTWDQTGSLGRTTVPLTVPASTYQIIPKINAGGDYVRLDALRTNLAPLTIGSDDIAVSSSFRVEFTITYEVEPEAQN